jgi:cytochrome P450
VTERVDPRLLAAHPAPGPLLDALGRCPVHPAGDGWYVAGRPDDVDEVLGHPAARAGIGGPGADDAIAALQARMARFSDGDDHRRRRDAAEAVLRDLDPDEVRRATCRAVDVHLHPGTIDLMPLARRVPATVLAHALDLPDAAAAVDAVDLLCRRLAPATADVERPDGARAADALARAFGPLDDAVVARVSVLFQTMDATAALVAAAVIAHVGHPGRDEAVPPIMLTTRTLAEGCRIGGVALPAGARVLVHLGAASVAGGNRTFGRGAHACPGANIATAIAAGFVDAIARHRVAHAEPGGPPIYEPRPNLRVPTRLPVVVR